MTNPRPEWLFVAWCAGFFFAGIAFGNGVAAHRTNAAIARIERRADSLVEATDHIVAWADSVRTGALRQIFYGDSVIAFWPLRRP